MLVPSDLNIVRVCPSAQREACRQECVAAKNVKMVLSLVNFLQRRKDKKLQVEPILPWRVVWGLDVQMVAGDVSGNGQQQCIPM